MPQVPALFLPKKKPDDTKQVKNTKRNKKKSPSVSDKKISALFKGRIDGYQENNSEVFRTT